MSAERTSAERLVAAVNAMPAEEFRAAVREAQHRINKGSQMSNRDELLHNLRHYQVDNPEFHWAIQQLINRLEAKDAADNR